MLARNASFTIIDFETTGAVDSFPNVPWQVGMVFFSTGAVQPEHTFNSLINVGERPFNRYAPGRHAQLRKEILAAPTMQDLWPILHAWLSNRLLVAHNVATERACLGQQFPMHSFGPWIDTLALARAVYPDAASHQLSDLLDALELRPQTDALCPGLAPHDALFDACASGLLLQHFLQLPDWQTVTVQDLIRNP